MALDGAGIVSRTAIPVAYSDSNGLRHLTMTLLQLNHKFSCRDGNGACEPKLFLSSAREE